MTTGIRHLSTYLNTSRPIVKELLSERGYDTTEVSDTMPIITKGECIPPIKLNKADEMIQVHYEVSTTRTNHKKISTSVKQIVESINESDNQKHLTIMFIVCDGMTPSVKEACRVLSDKYSIFIQIFPIRSLMFNITKHVIVPKHTRISKESYASYIGEFLESLHINSLDNIPKIIETDAVAMYIGLRPGDLCKITRPSKSAGVHIVYRYCVPDR